MKKKMLIAGNWKMNTVISESKELAEAIAKGVLQYDTLYSEIVVCTPYTSFVPVYELIRNTPIALGAQNCHHETHGAFTGEISAGMLKAVHCDYVIIGHSERRGYFGESDELINKKVKAAVGSGLKAIMCIGETLAERQAGQTFNIIETQLKTGLEDFEQTGLDSLIIAYEPVWAIGTGIAATNEQVQEAHERIREFLSSLFGNDAVDIHILYGGSMNQKNAEELLSIPDVNGGLIGGASLNADSFLSIITTAEKV